MNVAIVTAKGNNTSIPNKNVMDVAGKPLVAYPILAAQKASLIDTVYVSTNCERIASVARELGCRIIERPASLCTTQSHHGDTILHAIKFVKLDLGKLNLVTILLGNTVMVNSDLIDISLQILNSNPTYTGVMSVWQAQDDHPYRALEIKKDGSLHSYLNIQCGTSRQEYPAIYYYDQGVWSFRHEVASLREGPSPWWWLGKKVFPIVRKWVTGRDIHMDIDVSVANWWVSKVRTPDITNIDQIKKFL